jgi:hypothetical protein
MKNANFYYFDSNLHFHFRLCFHFQIDVTINIFRTFPIFHSLHLLHTLHSFDCNPHFNSVSITHLSNFKIRNYIFILFVVIFILFISKRIMIYKQTNVMKFSFSIKSNKIRYIFSNLQRMLMFMNNLEIMNFRKSLWRNDIKYLIFSRN